MFKSVLEKGCVITGHQTFPFPVGDVTSQSNAFIIETVSPTSLLFIFSHHRQVEVGLREVHHQEVSLVPLDELEQPHMDHPSEHHSNNSLLQTPNYNRHN